VNKKLGYILLQGFAVMTLYMNPFMTPVLGREFWYLVDTSPPSSFIRRQRPIRFFFPLLTWNIGATSAFYFLFPNCTGVANRTMGRDRLQRADDSHLCFFISK
jgi:hypothetical protein